MSEADWLGDALRHGVAIGDPDALLSLADALGFDEVHEPAWPSAEVVPGGPTDEIVRGMFTMVAQHVRSIDAQAAFAPLQLLVLLRGDTCEVQAFVAPLEKGDGPVRQHLMLLRPAVFVSVADRLLRALTCATVWPELGDLSTCRSEWDDSPLSNQPADPERFQLAMNLAMLASLIIFYHEMAHILRGHTAYLREASAFAGEATVLRENHALAMAAHPGSSEVDACRRALEVDADVHAGVFMASVLKLGALGDVNADNLPDWCSLCAFVASVTYNAFEAHAHQDGYRAGYHLPATRTECFLEGVARGLDATETAWFTPGVDAGFTFSAQHYQAPATLEELAADAEELRARTWPMLSRLTPMFSRHVPVEWTHREAAA